MPRGSGYAKPGNWVTLKRHILKRDHGICYVCQGQAVTVDHIKPVAQGGTHAHDNLAAICTPCHDAKTQREAQAGRRRHIRPTPKHPGLL